MNRPDLPAPLQRKSEVAAPPVYRPATPAATAPTVNWPNAAEQLQKKPGIAAPPVYHPATPAAASATVCRPNVAAQLQKKRGIAEANAYRRQPAVQPQRTPGATVALGVAVVQGRALEAEAKKLDARLSVHRFSGPSGNRTLQAAMKERKPNEHDLTIAIKEPKYLPWRRDVREIEKQHFEADLELFHDKVDRNNPKIIKIGIYTGIGDHVAVYAQTEERKWIKMDTASGGARLKYPNDEPQGRELGRSVPDAGLTRDALFRVFYEHVREHPFDFTDYNCQRFAGDLIAKVSKVDRGAAQAEDFSAFL